MNKVSEKVLKSIPRKMDVLDNLYENRLKIQKSLNDLDAYITFITNLKEDDQKIDEGDPNQLEIEVPGTSKK